MLGVIIVDLTNVSSPTDYFIGCSTRQYINCALANKGTINGNTETNTKTILEQYAQHRCTHSQIIFT